MRSRFFRSSRVFLLVLGFAVAASAQVYDVRHLNTEQIRALDREKTAVILPGGILEQHGPYLPSYSDGYMNERLAAQLADAVVARPGWNALVFPVIPLGAHGAEIIGQMRSFPGSYTVRPATLRAIFMDIAAALGEQGFRWIFIVHLHGAPEHNRMLDQAADFFRETYGGQMVNLAGLLSVFGALGAPLSEAEAAEEGFSIHAGMEEHSINLFLRPDRVSPDYRRAPPQRAEDFAGLVERARASDWPGYFGSPRLASAAHGAKVWEDFSGAAVAMALRILDGYDPAQEPRYADALGAEPTVAKEMQAVRENNRQLERRQADWLRKRGIE